MREVLVCDLVKDLLGPRGGKCETLADRPFDEYITGKLAPVGAETEKDGSGSEGEMAGTTESREGDADSGPGISQSSMLSPVLDPEKIPSTMGITFSASASGAPAIDVCVTWARYQRDANARKWRRKPKHAIFRIGEKASEIRRFDGDGNLVDNGGEISVHSHMDGDSAVRSVSIYVVNRIKVPNGGKATSDHHVFQPQIRIVCGEGTEIVPGSGTDADSKDWKEDEVLYRKKSLARGHLTSAVWRDVDPEINHPGSELDFPECATQPGFAWVDGEILPDADRAKFASCDARTEFVPMHNVRAPDFRWVWENPPQMKPGEYAEEYDKDSLRNRLEQFDLQYKRWIDDLRGMEVFHDDVKTKIVDAAKDAHRRIKLGIKIICEDDDARLAFCFANRAIDEQAKWAGRNDMEFRPFQLGFILMSAESILNQESVDRGVCDLLWVPTGGGKTEAYLFLVAMTAAYRRLQAAKSHRCQRSGEGVAVISRYTLRLLTIQQFRRTTALFTAMEYLRVLGLGSQGGVGWRPRGRSGEEDFLWGTAPFSVGLWVGGGVTPNRLEHTWFGKNKRPGALGILKHVGERGNHGEPAQILECPACRAVLATPKMGLESTEIHYVIRADAPKPDTAGSLSEIRASHLRISESRITENQDGVFTLSFKLHSDSRISDEELDGLWSAIEKRLKEDGVAAKLAAASPSRPGYFARNYVKDGEEREYDFEVFCPNPDCQLVTNWAGGAPLGRIHGRVPSCGDLADSVCGAQSPDGNYMMDVNGAFAIERNLASRIPIPALTVDEQAYRILPTMIVATVDKLARIPFEPKSGSLFGNADHHHNVKGYHRRDVEHPGPVGGREKNHKKLERKIRRPDLIIQDELHLLDGPLGSMVGIYESAVDHLCSGANRVKYIASTATAKRSGDHVKALFNRELAVFPPKGLDSDDRFFVREMQAHPLQDEAGRLHVGVCAPGRGALTPIVRIWSRLAQSACERREHSGIDPFWTVVGYFNTVRELAGARALYRQDIPDRIRHLARRSETQARTVREEKSEELSGRTESTDLPSILDLLDKKHPDSREVLDGLFTTSMFGTGVDVQRLGAMIVNGQPKTSSAYIQATGRVGRKNGAIVVTFYRASKPRDLNHYEFFVRHHSQLHRFVESPTVFPFAKRIRERAQGPVMVGMLRNSRDASQEWAKEDASIMAHKHNSPEVNSILEILEARSQKQPPSRKPAKGDTKDGMQSAVENWRIHAEQDPNLIYAEGGAEKSVVLGDPRHEHSDATAVYRNAPQSLRDIEEETCFET